VEKISKKIRDLRSFVIRFDFESYVRFEIRFVVMVRFEIFESSALSIVIRQHIIGLYAVRLQCVRLCYGLRDTADSIRKFDLKTNRMADSIRDSIRTKKNDSQVPKKIYNSVVYFLLIFCYAFGIYLQLLGASPPEPHRGSAPGPRWGTSVPRPPVLSP